MTAWRETRDRAPSRAIDARPPARQPQAASRSRVSSPSAANSGAASRTADARGARALALDMFASMFSSCAAQPALVHAERLVARDGRAARSKPDSTTVSRVPPGASSSRNSTSVVGSAE